MELDKTVTISKAFGILLMVLCHAEVFSPVRAFVATFHMPLFFFFAGYCFKDKYLQDSKGFVVKRIKGLYYPFVKYGLFFLALHNILFYLNIYNDVYGLGKFTSHLYTPIEFVKNGFLIVTSMQGQERLIGGYWFLHDLFFASLIAFACFKIVKSVKVGGAIIFTLTAIFFIID